jgi:hypothetical protein
MLLTMAITVLQTVQNSHLSSCDLGRFIQIEVQTRCLEIHALYKCDVHNLTSHAIGTVSP